MKGIPCASATSGARARDEITRLLARLGVEQAGVIEDFSRHEVVVGFVHRGRQVQLRASAAGWARMHLNANPLNGRRRATRQEWEQGALAQGRLAVSSILRDWVKAQLTAVEAGILSFEAVFLPHMIGTDGRTFLERAKDELPPVEDKVVMLGGPR
jgi:hypothetical protein